MSGSDSRKGAGRTTLTRRELLAALAAGGVALAAGRLGAGEPATEPVTRPVPSSGERIPVIGLGTSRVFEVGGSAEERGPLKAVVEQLATLANSMLDTSPMYGEAEAVAGDLVEALGVRDRLFLATKVWTSGRQAGIEQMERSLRLLRTDRVDLMQVHNLEDWRTHLETLRAWKADGRARYVGVTHYHAGAHEALERVMRAAQLDFVQLNYSLAEPEAADRLLPLARELGVAVIVNRPFARGRLFRAVKGRALPPWAERLGCRSWAQFFLKFAVGHPAVTCAIPGTSKLRHMVDNQGAGRGPLPDAAEQRRMLDLVRSL